MYLLMNVIGPILLGLALLWVVLRTWRRSRALDDTAERSAVNLREQLNEEDRVRQQGSR